MPMITTRRIVIPITFGKDGEFSAPVGIVDPLKRGMGKLECHSKVNGKRIGVVITGTTTAPILTKVLQSLD